MLTVRVPNTYTPERSYIIHTLLQDILGLDIQLFAEERKNVLLEDNGTAEGRTLHIADIFFQTPQGQWLTQDSLPKQPLARWDTADTFQDVPLITPKLPVIYGREIGPGGSTKNYLIKNQNGLHLGLDIFGSAFFMLTRYEEQQAGSGRAWSFPQSIPRLSGRVLAGR